MGQPPLSSNSATPAKCAGAGHVVYSLHHTGPFSIRNHEGKSFDFSMLPARVESAKGLATERYITNPLSESDRGLVDQFMRAEVMGRPLDGQYTIRVWDDPDVDFSKVEDIQLIVEYDHWTRQ